MAIQCADVETLVHTCLDGELADADAKALQGHLQECGSCKRLSHGEARFHSRLRACLAPPSLPASLRVRVMEELDREDWRARRTGAAQWGWALPAFASVAAAAALILFVVSVQGQAPETTPVAYDAVRQHMRRPPLEVKAAGVSPWVQRHVSPAAHVPRFSGPGMHMLGARLSHLGSRDAVQVFYEVGSGHRRYEISAMIFNASDLDLRGDKRQVIDGRELWSAHSQGYNVVAHKDARGIGYVFTSEMEAGALLDILANSDLLLGASEDWRSRDL